jgi:hypothetical protein
MLEPFRHFLGDHAEYPGSDGRRRMKTPSHPASAAGKPTADG